MGSCEDVNLESLSDCDYVKQGFYLWINNEPVKAIDFLDKRKCVLSVEYASVLLKFFNAIISFDRHKISEVGILLRDLEKKCTPEQGWLKSIRTRVFGETREFLSKKSMIEEIEKEIILADTLLCESILIGISCDISSYIKAALILRRAWKIYNQIFTEINEYFSDGLQLEADPSELRFSNTDSNQLPSPASSVCSNWTVPSLINHNVPQTSVITKSHSTVFTTSQKPSRLKKLSRHVAMTSFPANSENCDCDISDVEFKKELIRVRGAIYFGYGLLQIAFSFIPPQLKVINFLGYQGDRDAGLTCLKEAKNSPDSKNVMATIALLYYYLIIVPFFALENSDLTHEINIATQILNENESYESSALFLFFSGRRQRLKKKMKFAIMHFDAALRVPNLARELKMLVMHELGLSLLIELNFHDAKHYFNELKVSKFSKSYYVYLTSIACGAINAADESLGTLKENLQRIISASSQREGIIERFLMNRCNFVIPDAARECNSVFWRLLCYEILYLWNLLPSCSFATLYTIIDDCQTVDISTEPILGLSQFLKGACLSIVGDIEEAKNSYSNCIEMCNQNPSKLILCHIPAYASFDLAVLLSKCEGDESKSQAQDLLQNAQNYKNFDFDHRLKLKIHSFKIC